MSVELNQKGHCQYRNPHQFQQQRGGAKLNILIVLIFIGVGIWLFGGEKVDAVKRAAELKTAEVVGNIAQRNMPDDVAGGFHKIPVELRELAEGVYQTTGISNTHLIVTSEGGVLFDSGIALQAAKQIKLFREKFDGDVTHIILSHSHADHIGGTRFWKTDDTEVIAHRQYAEEQRYLTELEPYLWTRNRIVFPWLPENPPTQKMFKYGGVEPTLEVGYQDYDFVLGETSFKVLSTPGAEGADNLSLWLPGQKILFSGDFFGPLWPQFPNIFTMRGEKMRKPIEYIQSLNKLIALEPEMIVPSHHDPIVGKENIRAGMVKMRDAVQYVHDAVVAGMNDGKTVHQLMDEIRLPPELDLTQEHGMVSWGVKSIWEYYATWFHFDSTTELYTVPVREIYPELSELVSSEVLMSAAQRHFEQGNSLKTLHYLEMVLAGNEQDNGALQLRLTVLQKMLDNAIATHGNSYEKDYLRSRVLVTKTALGIGDE